MSTDVRAQLPQLRRLPAPELRQRWRDLMGTDPPEYNRKFLVSRLAYRIQETAYGGLSAPALAAMEALLDDAGCDKLGRMRRRYGRTGRRKLLIGTRVAREWNGQRHEVTVVQGGFEYHGNRFPSLSAIARIITGTRWNGPAFFGLREKRGQQ